MEIILAIIIGVLVFSEIGILLAYFQLYHQHKNQRLILTAINSTEDIEYILSQILSLMKKVLKKSVSASVVAIAEESQLRVLYPSMLEDKKMYHFFSSLSRLEMYQFLLQCFSLTKNIFVANVLGETSNVSPEVLSFFQRFQNRRKGKYNYLIIPIYDKEIAGIVAFEAVSDLPFTYREAKRLQKKIPFLNIAFSRVLLLWNLRQQSITDPLTELLNKRQFVLMAEKVFSLAKRREQLFALAILDIDNFKCINDTYGHHVGDVILKDIAEILVSESRQADYLFRVGGDEFCVLFSDMLRPEEIKVYSDRVYEAVKNYQERKPSVIKETITISIGWAIENNASSWVEVFEKADKHMYEQKRKNHENYWYKR